MSNGPADQEEVLYEEKLNRGEMYVCKPDAKVMSGRYLSLVPEGWPRSKLRL